MHTAVDATTKSQLHRPFWLRNRSAETWGARVARAGGQAQQAGRQAGQDTGAR